MYTIKLTLASLMFKKWLSPLNQLTISNSYILSTPSGTVSMLYDVDLVRRSEHCNTTLLTNIISGQLKNNNNNKKHDYNKIKDIVYKEKIITGGPPI